MIEGTVEARRFDGDKNQLISILEWVCSSGYRMINQPGSVPNSLCVDPIDAAFLLMDADLNPQIVRQGDWVVLHPSGKLEGKGPAIFEEWAELMDPETNTYMIDE